MFDDTTPYNYNCTGYRTRILSPNRYSSRSAGQNPSARNPSSELPHPNRSVAYMLRPASGSSAPPTLRSTVFAASAEAAYMVNASTRYAMTGMKKHMLPTPTRAEPRIGTIQCVVLACAAQPYQNRPPAIKGPERRSKGRRSSGLTGLPLAARARMYRSLVQMKTSMPRTWPTPRPMYARPAMPMEKE